MSSQKPNPPYRRSENDICKRCHGTSEKPCWVCHKTKEQWLKIEDKRIKAIVITNIELRIIWGMAQAYNQKSTGNENLDHTLKSLFGEWLGTKVESKQKPKDKSKIPMEDLMKILKSFPQ
jgi:hypothetical protein